jgi:hypothetical protein
MQVTSGSFISIRPPVLVGNPWDFPHPNSPAVGMSPQDQQQPRYTFPVPACFTRRPRLTFLLHHTKYLSSLSPSLVANLLLHHRPVCTVPRSPTARQLRPLATAVQLSRALPVAVANVLPTLLLLIPDYDELSPLQSLHRAILPFVPGESIAAIDGREHFSNHGRQSSSPSRCDLD